MKAYSYQRFSKPEQGKGTSLERQTELTAELCSRNGWRLDTRLYADKGKSGFSKGQQTKLYAFLEAIKAKQVEIPSVLIVEKLDRLSRQKLDHAMDLMKEILRAGVSIAACDSGHVYDRDSLNDISQVIQMQIIFDMNNKESQKKHERSKWNAKHKRQKFDQDGTPIYGGCCPAWMEYTDGKYKLKPEAVKAIKWIYKQSIKGFGVRTIYEMILTEKIPPFTKAWSLRYVDKLCTDRTIIGEFQRCELNDDGSRTPIGPPIPNYYPAAISEELFYTNLAARKVRFKKRGPRGAIVGNLLQGIATDFESFPLHMAGRDRSGRKRIQSTAPNSITWLYEDLEMRFLGFIHEINQEMVVVQDKDDPLPKLMDKLTVIDGKIDTITKEMESGDFASGLKWQRKLDVERELIVQEIELAKTDAHQGSTDGFETAVELLKRTTDRAELKAVRMRLGAILRGLIDTCRIAVTADQENRLEKELICAVEFKDGRKRGFQLLSFNGKIYGYNLVNDGHLYQATRQADGMLTLALAGVKTAT